MPVRFRILYCSVNGGLRVFLFSADWLSGISSAMAYCGLSCASHHLNRFIHAVVAAVALLLAVWVGFFVVGSIWFGYRKEMGDKFKTFWFVSAMVVLDISYIG